MIPLLVDLESQWRGGQSQFLLLLKGLYERGHAAELVAVHGSSLSHRAKKLGIHVHSVSRRAPRLATALKIRALLAEGRVELVHANEPHALTSAWLARSHKKLPLLVSRRVAYPLHKGKIARGRYLAAHRILAISRFVRNSVLEYGIPAEKLELIYEGVEVPAPVSSEMQSLARQRWRVSNDEFLFGCVGYLLPEKGQEFAVRALAEVRAKHPKVRLLLAGDGVSRPHLETLVREYGLEDAVIFTGFVKDIEQVYAALDAFVFPSLAEPLGTSLLAAMAWGLPVLAVANGGVPEYVESDHTGLLVPQPQPALLSAGMVRLASDPNLARALGTEAGITIRANFSADRMVENTLHVYERALQARH